MAKYLIDLSTWARRTLPEVKERWHELNFKGELASHPFFAIEVLHGSRNPLEFEQQAKGLRRHFEWVTPDEHTARIALELQREMAAAAPTGQRVKSLDLMIAALAEQKGYGVLHYDADYDLINELSRASFTSEWVVPRGSIGSPEAIRSDARELRKRYRDGLQARLLQLSEEEEFKAWPELIATADRQLIDRGIVPPPPIAAG